LSNDIVEVTFGSGDTAHRHYAIYRGFDGKILEWFDLDNIITEEEQAKLPDEVRDQLACDGTAFFSTMEEATKVLEAINNS